MRFSLICLLATFALTGCDSAFGPDEPLTGNAPGMAVTGSYTASILPGGPIDDSMNSDVHITDDGFIYGAITPDGATTEQAVRWTIGADGSVSSPTALGALPAPYNAWDQKVMSAGAAGTVVGYADEYRSTTTPTVGWIWTGGTMTLLPQPEGVYDVTILAPQGVNDAGAVVGQIRLEADGVWEIHPALWLPPYTEAPLLLPRPEGYALADLVDAKSITNDGVVTGFVRKVNEDADAAVRWHVDASGTVLSGPTLLPGSEGRLVGGVNEALDIVGSSMLLRAGASQGIVLPDLDGSSGRGAYDVSERRIDGGVYISGFASASEPVVWEVDASDAVTGPVALGLPPSVYIPKYRNRPAQTLAFTNGIAETVNRQGWAAGWSEREDGRYYPTLWQPAEDGGGDPPPGDGPVASFTFDCANSATCQFTDTSTGGATAWVWSFGDGSGASVQHPTHTYTSGGLYSVTLAVEGGGSQTSETSVTVDCTAHPRHGLRCR